MNALYTLIISAVCWHVAGFCETYIDGFQEVAHSISEYWLWKVSLLLMKSLKINLLSDIQCVFTLFC